MAIDRTSTAPHPYPDNAAMTAAPLPLRIEAAPDPLECGLEPLLGEPFASAWAGPTPPSADPLRARLLERAAAAHAAAAPMLTARLRRLSVQAPSPGVALRTLYEAPAGRPLRPGEPRRARLLQLAPGSRWLGADPTRHREWLVLRGEARVGAVALGERDYRAEPAGTAAPEVSSTTGAWLFVRESDLPARPGDQPLTVRDAEAGWPEFAPGVRRRVLWQRDGAAALLYHTGPGAVVPHHTHGHDEECLMLQGELFLDDLLLQAGDYQVAPAGTGHRVTTTDTGVVLFAHGDLELRFVT